MEHVIHVGHAGHVPLRDVTGELIRCGDYFIIKQVSHIGRSRNIPGPDRPVRTLGAIGRQFQAQSNGGLELRLRLWSPPCGGALL